MEKGETICRLCLKDSNDNFTVLDANATEFVGFLLKSNLSVNIGALICAECTRSIKACTNFKSKCLDVENVILQRINHNMLDENYILDHDVCRLCMCSLKMYPIMSLDDKAGDAMLEKIMLEKCLPELDTRITEKPIICSPCRESLQHYFGFITNCLNVEENIKKYCAAACIDCTGLIKLKDVIEFITEQKFIKVDEIKIEDCGDVEPVDEEKCNSDIVLTEQGVQQVEFKVEETLFEEMDCKIEPKCENSRDMEEQQFGNVDDQEHLNRFEAVSPQPVVTTRLHRKQECLNSNLQGDPSSKPHSQVTLRNKKMKLTPMYQCDFCPHQTKTKSNLKKHLLLHKDPPEVTMYKCNNCLYQTRRKSSLNSHLLKHKDPSEVTMYSCDSCLFQTKQKSTLKNHLLLHKDLSEVTMYNCGACFYQTKHKRYLKTHLLLHKDPSEVTMYKCDSCLYQTKQKRYLKSHLLHHKDPSEETMYKCDSCLYQTKQKQYLLNHLLLHKDPSKVTMYKCDSCLFQTRHKHHLKNHLLLHKDPSEVTMYKCDSCLYQTKFKMYLKSHLLRHRDPSEVTMKSNRIDSFKSRLVRHKDSLEVTMYNCDSCSYQTRHKACLKLHILKHKDPSEVTMYNCDSCSYQTTRKSDLKLHVLKHKERSEVTMYNCYNCSYQAIRKSNLARHLLKHKYSSEVKMYKCDSCRYQTKYKSTLKRHILTHSKERVYRKKKQCTINC